jgi:Zn-finger protein
MVWKLRRDIKFYKEVTGEVNAHKQNELNYYLGKLNRQKTFCYCPLCGNELISSGSFVSDDDVVTYKCTKCLLVSRWDFDAPAPVLLLDKK